jgi:uncharacterized membrane protein
LSSALGRLLPRRASTADALDAKGERRDARQVVANGGVAAVALHGAPVLATWTVTAALAAAAADTWATAFGMRAGARPRLLLFGPTVAPGTNGGMTWVGCAGALCGALAVGVAASLAMMDPLLAVAAAAAGVAGMAFDSLLGATAQGRHHCPRCNLPSDWRRHRCGASTTHVGGVAWLDNDLVNLCATALGGLLGALWWRAVHP